MTDTTNPTAPERDAIEAVMAETFASKYRDGDGEPSCLSALLTDGEEQDFIDRILALSRPAAPAPVVGDVAALQVIEKMAAPATPDTAWETLKAVLLVVRARMEAHVEERAALTTPPSTTGLVAALEDVARHAGVVMAYLCEDGPSIVPHLMDSDDNPGQRLRDALAALSAAQQGVSRAPPLPEQEKGG